MYIPVLKPGTTRLLFKYDHGRQLVEIQIRGEKTVVDLQEEWEKWQREQSLSSTAIGTAINRNDTSGQARRL